MSKTKIAGSGSIRQRHGSADPDPHQKCHGSGMVANYFAYYFFSRAADLYGDREGLVDIHQVRAKRCQKIKQSADVLQNYIRHYNRNPHMGNS